MIDSFLQDLRHGIRSLLQTPGFTLVAVLTLALGIGANTAIFSVINAVMLRMLPVRDPQQLVQLEVIRADGSKSPFGETFSYPVVQALQPQTDVFAGVCAFSAATFQAGPRGSTEPAGGAWMTGECYETLGVPAVLGRVLSIVDDQPGAEPVAVISYGYWERTFGRDTTVAGRSIFVEGIPVTIVGVTAEGFAGANVAQLADITMSPAVLPKVFLASIPDSAALLGPGNIWLHILARPRPDVSLEQAKARLAARWTQIAAEHVVRPRMSPEQRQAVLASRLDLAAGGTGWSYLRGEFKQPLFVLMAVVGLVLLIACANVANLLLVRAAARQREIGIRLALGATRTRVMRQLLIESALLAACAGALGVFLAYEGSRLLLQVFTGWQIESLPLDVGPDAPVLAFTVVISLLTAVLFGLTPAWRATSVNPGQTLSQHTLRATGSRSRLPALLATSQVALSLIVLIVAGLFIQTLLNLSRVDPGFQPDGVLVIDVDPRRNGYTGARLAALYQELLGRLSSLPGVTSASLSRTTPLSGFMSTDRVVVDGRSMPARSAYFHSVAPKYFATMGTPLVSGREFTLRDSEGGPLAAIVNEAFVEKYIGTESPLEKRISVEGNPARRNMEIVGVVRNAIYSNLRESPPPTVYIAYFQDPSMPGGSIEVRASGSTVQIASAARQSIRTVLPDAPIQIHGLSEQVDAALTRERLLAALAGFFGLLALALAVLGLYGLMAYRVARRTGEIGIRMALGAERTSVVSMVFRETLALVTVGIVVGISVALGTTHLLGSLLFGLTPTDPATVAATAALILGVGLLAACLPARRAASVDPLVALRYE